MSFIEPRLWQPDVDPSLENHRTVPHNTSIAIGELFTRLCVVSVPEKIVSPLDAIRAYEVESKRLLEKASIALLEHEFVVIGADQIPNMDDPGITESIARQKRVPESKRAGLGSEYYLGVIVPKIEIIRSVENRRGIDMAVGSYYLDSVLYPHSGHLLLDVRREQISMRPRKDIEVPYILFDLDVLLGER